MKPDQNQNQKTTEETKDESTFVQKVTQFIFWIASAVVLFFVLMLFAQVLFAQEVAPNAPDAQQLLINTDQTRGGGLLGLTWEIQLNNSGADANNQSDQRLRVQATENASLAEVLEPANSKGAKILQVERNMWMSKPGLKKPVAISPRQRLSGQAAIGDIAATNYAKNYQANYVREEIINGELCHVLDLSANNRQTTYDKITYWVSKSRGLAIQADFLALSGKKIKSAQFEYDNKIVIKDKNQKAKTTPFVSKMIISDVLTDAKTMLIFSHVQSKEIAEAVFDVGNLQ